MLHAHSALTCQDAPAVIGREFQALAISSEHVRNFEHEKKPQQLISLLRLPSLIHIYFSMPSFISIIIVSAESSEGIRN